MSDQVDTAPPEPTTESGNPAPNAAPAPSFSAPAQQPASDPAPATDDAPPASFIDSLPEEYRNNPSLSHFQSQDALLKSYLEQRSMLGKKGMMRPGDDATAEDRAAWHELLGVPSDITGYDDYEFPKDDHGNPLLEISDTEQLNSVKQAFLDAEMTPAQMKVAFDAFAQDKLGSIQTLQEQQSQMATQTISKLESEWGGDYEHNRIAILNTLEKNNLMDYAEESGLVNNYDFIKMMEKVVKNTGEAAITGDNSISGGGWNAEIDRIKTSAAFTNPGHPEHKEALQSLENAYRKRLRT